MFTPPVRPSSAVHLLVEDTIVLTVGEIELPEASGQRLVAVVLVVSTSSLLCRLRPAVVSRVVDDYGHMRVPPRRGCHGNRRLL